MKRLALLVVLCSSTAAFAGPATDAVKKANDTISDELKNKAPAEKVTTSVNDFIDIDQLGQRAMGSNWAGLKPAEQKDFLKLLHQVIEANYVKGMNANLNYKVNYTGEGKDSSGSVVVKTEIETQKRGRPIKIEVDYVVDAKNHAFDVITDGSGLVQAYNDQFTKMMANGGIQNVMTRMQSTLDKIKASNGS
jgi:ABC-type transporter MlaC component|nr:ABC transporter substrate-binding protein [Kofleriaceae bacterium]